MLMHDLRGKSEALVNQMIPRNPIKPRNKKYPQHSEFGFNLSKSTVQKKFADM